MEILLLVVIKMSGEYQKYGKKYYRKHRKEILKNKKEQYHKDTDINYIYKRYSKLQNDKKRLEREKRYILDKNRGIYVKDYYTEEEYYKFEE